MGGSGRPALRRVPSGMYAYGVFPSPAPPQSPRIACPTSVKRHPAASMWGGHGIPAAMLYLTLKAVVSGALIAVASTLAKRYPGFGALIASLPGFGARHDMAMER